MSEIEFSFAEQQETFVSCDYWIEAKYMIVDMQQWNKQWREFIKFQVCNSERAGKSIILSCPSASVHGSSVNTPILHAFIHLII